MYADGPTLGDVFREFERPLRALCLRLVGPEESEDLCQEAFVKIVENFAAYDRRRPLRSWVFKIAANACIDFMRTRHSQPLEAEIEDVAPDASEVTLRAEDVARVQELIARLPLSLRLPMVMKYGAGLDHSEIAEALELTPANLRVRLVRGRQRLRELLVQQEGVHEL